MATKNRSRMLLTAAVAGMLAAGMVSTATAAEGGNAEKVKCYGANACKGTGACAGAGHACGGKNACKGQGFVEVDSKEACLKLAGGRLTPEK